MSSKALAVTVEEAARMLSISRCAVYKLLRDGKLPRIKIGGSTRIAVASIELLIAGNDAYDMRDAA